MTDRKELIKTIESMMIDQHLKYGQEPSTFIPHDAAEEVFWWERGMKSRWVEAALQVLAD